MSELPIRITTLRVSHRIVQETSELFEPYRANRVEGCVLWYGRVLAGDVCQVMVTVRPDQRNAPQNYSISSEAIRAVRHVVRPQQLLLLTQIHTHPRRAFFSEWDAAHALNKQQGALNLIIPDFGNIDWDKLNRCCMVEHDGHNNWNEWSPLDWQRLCIADSDEVPSS